MYILNNRILHRMIDTRVHNKLVMTHLFAAKLHLVMTPVTAVAPLPGTR